MSVSGRWSLCAGLLMLMPHAMAEDCFTSTILKPTPFMGNNNEIFKLADGSIWQVKYEYEYLYEYYPNVIVCPNVGRLIIKDKKLNIVKISDSALTASSGRPSRTAQRPAQSNLRLIESQIDGDYNGWTGNTIYKLVNGQVWQQVDAHYHYHYSYSPKVMIYPTNGSFKIHVDGDSDDDVSVQRPN
ncbi:MAG TPA: hypothetical protein VGC27_10705 [Rhizomicrobium sp.]